MAWLNDPEVVRYSEQRHYNHTMDSVRKFKPDLMWAIIAVLEVHETRAGPLPEYSHIGNISAQLDLPNKVADISMMIGDRGVWGQGYGREAWKAVMDWLFLQGVRKVTGGCMAGNEAMVKIFERVGMEPDYVRGGHFLVDGERVDSLHYRVWK